MSTTRQDDMPERMALPAKAAAALLGISRAQFWKLHAAGKIPLPVRLGAGGGEVPGSLSPDLRPSVTLDPISLGRQGAVNELSSQTEVFKITRGGSPTAPRGAYLAPLVKGTGGYVI